MRIFLLLLFLTFPSMSVNAIEVNDLSVSCPANLALENVELDMQKFRGKVVYLDFWATWCPPCMKSMPFLNGLRNELSEQGFEIIAISVDEEPKDVQQFLKQHPVDYLIATDSTGQCPQAYDVKAMPSAYLIDRKGVVRYIHLGFRDGDEEEIRKYVMALLAEKIGI